MRALPPNALPRLLAQYLCEYRPGPFCWHTAHCGHFAGGWVLRTTGHDALAVLPALASAQAWARRVRALGGLAAVVTHVLRCPPVPPQQAQLGDVVMLPGPVTGGTLGLCAGRTAVVIGEDGTCVHLPMTEALHAWPLALVCAGEPA